MGPLPHYRVSPGLEIYPGLTGYSAAGNPGVQSCCLFIKSTCFPSRKIVKFQVCKVRHPTCQRRGWNAIGVSGRTRPFACEGQNSCFEFRRHVIHSREAEFAPSRTVPIASSEVWLAGPPDTQNTNRIWHHCLLTVVFFLHHFLNFSSPVGILNGIWAVCFY